MGAVQADHRRQSRSLRAHRPHGVAVVGIEQDLLGLWAPPRRTPTTDPHVGVPVMSDRPRQRPQCCQGHSRCRAGRETKRLWSPCKPATCCGSGC
jgi:hypothetical protein